MYQYIRMNEKNRNDLQGILTQALNEIKDELGEKFNIDKVNLREEPVYPEENLED